MKRALFTVLLFLMPFVAYAQEPDWGTMHLPKLRQRAESGNAGAQFYLGVRYGFGQGVAQDDREAMKWYRKAAEQGFASAQYNLGVMYRDGRGVPQDYREAVKWFRNSISTPMGS